MQKGEEKMARILIVDDSPTIHRVLKLRVVAAGHEVVAFGSDGNEGAALYEAHLPDLVLMDITMPNCDGREALQKIIAIAPHAKVLMLSAISEPVIVEDCMRKGACGFATKDRLNENGYIEKIISEVFLTKSA